MQVDGQWLTKGMWGGGLWALGEMAEIGLPMAYAAAGAHLTVFSGDTCFEFSRQELMRLLSGGVLLDGWALQRLNELGFAAETGFAAWGRKDRDATEVFTKDPINGKFAGWHRDCRPSFWPEPGFLIEPTNPKSRTIAEVIDFMPTNHGPTSGIFENELGGRVAVLGYYPWKMIHSFAKTSQMKSLLRWLSHDRLPAYVASYHKAALWCRRDAKGTPAILLVNASLDAVDGVQVAIRDVGTSRVLTRMNSTTARLVSCRASAPYALFGLPRLAPWEVVLIA